MATWFTSDPHFGHRNIITYCNRPFADLDEMHTTLRSRWNEVVAPQDEVWVLGDFVFGSPVWGSEILASLHGTKHLIMGNHDRASATAYRRMGFSIIQTSAEIEIDSLKVRMQHRPPSFEGGPKLTLCGHVHDRWKWDPMRLTLNVGVDQWDFRPISAAQVAEELIKPAEGFEPPSRSLQMSSSTPELHGREGSVS